MALSINTELTPSKMTTRHNWTVLLAQIPSTLWCILLLGATLRLVMAFTVPLTPEHWSDASNYHHIAKNLSEGLEYSLGDGQPTRVRPPTYPIFLAIIYTISGPNPQVAVTIQAFLGLLTIVFAYILGTRVFDQRTGLLSAFVVSTYPALVYYDTRLLREGFTALLVIAIFILAVDAKRQRQGTKRALLLGLMLAITSMSRPEMLLLAAPAAYLLIRPIHNLSALWRPALLIALPILLVWVPWTARSYVLFGSISPISKGLGSTLWFGNRWAAIDGDNHKPGDRAALQRLTKERFTNLSDNEQERRNLASALDDIKKRPTWFLSMVAKKTVLFWRDANGVKKTLPRIHPALPYMLNAYYYALLLLALGASLWLCKKREWVRPLFAAVMTYMMIYALLHVRNRYRVPILPVVFVLAAGGFWALYDLLKAWLNQSFNRRLKNTPGGHK